MKRIFLSMAVLGLMMSAAAEDKVLMTIDGEPVMASEFMYIYQKNNQETALEQKTIDEYLDLFINFKLKVHEAKQQGIDTTEAFKKELAGYRAQATPKYLKDEVVLVPTPRWMLMLLRPAAMSVMFTQKTVCDSASLSGTSLTVMLIRVWSVPRTRKYV